MRFTVRLWIGFGVLVAMLAVTVAIALSDLEANRAVLRDLVDRRLPLQVATHGLVEALAGHREASLLARTLPRGRSAAAADRAAGRVAEALTLVEERATAPAARETAAALTAAWTLCLADGTSAPDGPDACRRARLLARSLAVLAAERVAAADARGLRLIRRQMLWLALVAAGMLLVALGLARAAAHTLLRPVRRLTEAVAAVTRGEHHRRLPATGRDELAAMATAVNALLDRFEVERQRSDYERTTLRRVVRALLDRDPAPAVVTDGGGGILATNAPARRLLAATTTGADLEPLERRIGARIAARRDDAGDAASPGKAGTAGTAAAPADDDPAAAAAADDDDRIARCEPLALTDGPRAGWLVHLRPPPDEESGG